MKTSAVQAPGPIRYEFARFLLDPARRLLTDKTTGTPVDIAGKTFDALLLFVENPGTLLTRQQLIQSLWPQTIVEDNNLNKLIAALRRTLGDSDGERFVVTVQGRGYQFVMPVLPLHESATDPGKPDDPVAIAAPSRPRRATPWIAMLVIGGVLGISLIGLLGPQFMADAVSQPLSPLARVSPITSLPGDELSPSLSPEGTQVAFSWEGTDGNPDIYIGSVSSGSEPLRLTRDGAADRDPAWSPDGMRIAFLRQRDPHRLDLIVIPALGGPERILRSVSMQFVSKESAPRLAWTADSQQLIYTDQAAGAPAQQSFHLYRLAIESGTVTELTRGAGLYDTSPAMSPNGKWLAFVRYVNAERLGQLRIQRLDDRGNAAGNPTVVPGLPAATVHSLNWSADSTRLTFVVGSNIHEWVLGGQSRIAYTGAGILGGSSYYNSISSLSMHRDRKSARAVIAKIDNPLDIWALQLDPASHAAIGTPRRRVSSTALEQHPRFSPDGRRLAFISGRSGRAAIWLADADGGNPRQLTHLPAVVTGYPHWSPDGMKLAFHASLPGKPRQVFIMDTTGGEPLPVAAGCCPEWSADGRHLWYGDIGPKNEVMRMRVDTRHVERLFSGDLPIETPDGRRLIYASIDVPGLFQRTITNNTVAARQEPLVTDYTPTIGGIAPVDDGFFYIGHTPAGRPRAIRFYDYGSRQARDIAPAPPSTALGLTVSPDGRELLYAAGTSESGADLVLLEFQ